MKYLYMLFSMKRWESSRWCDRGPLGPGVWDSFRVPPYVLFICNKRRTSLFPNELVLHYKKPLGIITLLKVIIRIRL